MFNLKNGLVWFDHLFIDKANMSIF